MYVTDFSSGSVKKIPKGGGAMVIVGSGFSSPSGIAIDGAGDIFVSEHTAGTVKEIPAGGGATIIIGSGFSFPEGVAVDGAGNVYVADYGLSDLKKITPLGGYFVGPFLPIGLTFDGSSGTISGTPTAARLRIIMLLPTIAGALFRRP